MKKIKLTEKELTRIITKVIKEDSEVANPCRRDSLHKALGERGYKFNGYMHSKPVNSQPEIGFGVYVEEPMGNQYRGECHLFLLWEDGMRKIDLGVGEEALTLLDKFEETLGDVVYPFGPRA